MTIPRSVRANALRDRHLTMVKKSIDVVHTLTAEACVSTIAVYSQDLEENWKNYADAFNEHEDSLIGKDQLDAVAMMERIREEYVEIRGLYIKAKIKIGKLLAAANAAAPTGANMFNSSVINLDHSLHGNGDNAQFFKLPAARLPTFSGEMKDWVEFKATCKMMLTDKVHDVHRLQQLKESLTGEPRELVQHILPGEGAYDRAMVLLKKRYENTRAIVNNQLQRLYRLPHNDPNRETRTTLKSILITIESLTAALKGCDIDTSTWDAILIFNTTQCMHIDSRKAWEETLKGTRAVPSLAHYLDFLDSRMTILETTETFPTTSNQYRAKSFAKNQAQPHHNQNNKAKILFTLRADYKCAICARNHLSSRCDELPRLSVHERKTAVDKAHACTNCLQTFHLLEQCPFDAACKKCSGKHHTLLHEDSKNVMLTQMNVNTPEISPETTANTDENVEDAVSTACSEFFYHVHGGTTTILATAMVPVQRNGRSVLLKALIDQGSTANLITHRACQMLKLSYEWDSTPMMGIGNTPVGQVMGRTCCTISSIHDKNYQHEINALVVQRITDISPTNKSGSKEWDHLSGLQLADPNFIDTHKVDLLLGAAAYAEIIIGDIIKGNPNEPIAQLTKLGWIVFGQAQMNTELREWCNAIQPQSIPNADDDLLMAVKAFWDIEEVEVSTKLSASEIAAEEIFVQSLTRAPDGKFMVDLPFKVDPKSSNCLGESRLQAERRFRSTQRRFATKPSVLDAYNQNINEYLILGHMIELEDHEVARCFLPHHPVVKESSSTTKVRSVYDASAKTTNGRSLNDILHVGPTIQPDLFDLLIKWRKYRYAFTGDIEKMYRQVWINPEHALFQCILWQPPNSDEIKTYKLLTVTFGTASAPYQAIRAVDEIANRIEAENKELAEQIRKCFYVDDYLGSADDIETAIRYREQITRELAKYGFNLRKWKSNDERILVNVESSDREEVVDFTTTFKTLGIAWQPSTDTFQFKSSQPNQTEVWTKRKILSEIAKLFDPLGWLSPCVVKAKMLMQEIWRLPNKYDWDTPVPKQISLKWQKIYEQLCLPIPITVPRWIGITNDASHIEIHGFCDASTAAYVAAVYIVVWYSNDHAVSNLLASKTKLAPIKTVTIPRLELCGAVLLTKLLKRCLQPLALTDYRMFAWTDSMIVLSWLAACPSRWNTFVSNRVSLIQKDVPFEHWNHVPTKQNPADIASRGALIEELKNSTLWWHGPDFLRDVSIRPIKPTTTNDGEIPEKKGNIKIFHVVEQTENYVLSYFSSYKSLITFTVYAMRWFKRVRNRNSALTAQEITSATNKWIKIVQSEMFNQDIYSLQHGGWARTPILRQLNPFIDAHGILRMNGRVGNADLREQKTAIILPPKHKLTELIIREAHKEVLHGGVQLTLRKLREKFFIIHARSQVQSIIHKCVNCFRFRKERMQQQMAELPSFRTEQARPFAFVGCDYAGFFEIKTSARRNSPTTKGYIALFICLTTKAIHLELVGDLSTAEFIMAFENFIARRGIPILLYTDNGTNFIGGAKEIKKFLEQLFTQNNAVSKLLAFKNIKCKTLPARASHMAGIWERAVGSVKYHLRRTLKDTKLNARQFDHVLKQIEACLNSRPLWAVSAESDDIEVLTPSHFFNFEAINTLPRPDVSHIKMNRLDQYQYLYRLYCDFWKAWSHEYLHQLQPRTKWQKECKNAAIGQIVLISEDNMPPSRWAIGKIVAVHPAKDGLIRTVEVKCGKTILRRPIHKLALLPIADNDQLELSAQGRENVGE